MSNSQITLIPDEVLQGSGNHKEKAMQTDSTNTKKNLPARIIKSRKSFVNSKTIDMSQSDNKANFDGFQCAMDSLTKKPIFVKLLAKV